MDMQERIAARRAELERVRLAEETAARVKEDAEYENQRVRERAAAARMFARDAAVKARDADRLAASVDQNASHETDGVAAAERMIAAEAGKRWDMLERVIVGLPLIAGVLLLSSHPVWAMILLFFGAMLFAGAKDTHRKAVLKEHPELAAAVEKPKKQ